MGVIGTVVESAKKSYKKTGKTKVKERTNEKGRYPHQKRTK